MRGFPQDACTRQERSLDVHVQWGTSTEGASPPTSTRVPGAQGHRAPAGILLSARPWPGAGFEKGAGHRQQDLPRPEAAKWKATILRVPPSHPLWTRHIKSKWRIKRHLLTEIFDKSEGILTWSQNTLFEQKIATDLFLLILKNSPAWAAALLAPSSPPQDLATR